MSNPKARALPDIFSMFFAVLAFYCIDVFLFKTDLTIIGTPIFAWLMGFAVLIMYVRASRSSYKLLGISLNEEKIKAGLIYGVCLAAIPIAVVVGAECVYLSLTSPGSLDIVFSSPNSRFVDENANIRPFTIALVYSVSVLLTSLFKEFFFRGFVLKTLVKSTSFARANLIQSGLCMSLTLVIVLRDYLLGVYDSNAKRFVIFIVAFGIIKEMLAGIKRGMMTRVSGSTYIALMDNFVYTYFSTCILVIPDYKLWTFMPHMLSIQVLSFLLALIYYKTAMKKINAKKAQRKAREEAISKESEARRKTGKESSINDKTEGIEEISPESFKKIARHSHHSAGRSLSDEEMLQGKKTIEQTLTNHIEVTSSEDVDDLLKKLTKEMSGHKKHRSREITADFDADEYLSSYGKDSGKKHRHHRSEPEKHKTESVDKKSGKVQPKKQVAKKPKLTFAQKLQSLGGIDDSSSNDLI
ncbi:MAG: CPBP family intramembrane metalloprotease [Clostridia bacterium]|nr:CPBP family intramembrane metalloprotease [Clostridia bacterium]